ncbi:hypothetical protein LTR91_006610 [Friedmanniomyces endolithicus]|uniref:RING-type domain-containing protein n=1 Tax=Friedmanniomyces endolithicus TaxID=329885 RepID=A0AAN6KQP7_9PEZI|nr:hypothetical protein LTR35_006583 [Friedmanniomyces endolithicus]KAK0297155.1 hypothetical protein LTS00_004434 [Friedmanniomyces endolithicus]KAK0928043.1 hypothetical protein LTR57_002777 [Friedmanniomyces endolithicus]KAK0997643.1 hypothetical protein LTR91_006610 [Friedmanniomyces endolithicus]KAK1012718.1 hypothetical protein LTR54_004645 [Friedmanniomyces endolithicus]
MAPINEYAVVTVTSAQVRASDDDSIIVEAGSFTPARWFLEHAASASNDDVEPPRKKQRISKNAESPGTPAHDTPPQNDIPIHRVRIDLHFPDTLKSTSASPKAIEDDLDFEEAEEVSVVPFGIDSDFDGSRIRLTALSKLGAVLMIECSDIPQSAREALRQIALPGQLRSSYSRMRERTHPATRLSCTLKRSLGHLYTVIRLEASVFWRSGVSVFPSGKPGVRTLVYDDYNLMTQAYQDAARDDMDQSREWTPHEFYDSVHVPDKSNGEEGIYSEVLSTELYPFQKRAVTWMLRREGVKFETQQLIKIPREKRKRLDFWEPVRDVDGKECYVSFLQGIVSHQPLLENDPISGGLLAEEMGLGKTVEILSLVALHKRINLPTREVLDDFSGSYVTPSRATLIITPASILQQWITELGRHAPSLRVKHYEGVIADGKKLSDARAVQDMANDYDVVLTTYLVLGQEIHYAQDPPDRSMRHARRFDRKRTPLVQIQWWRICIDEAQMVESGVAAAARVACRLPRIHSWAVSGTPLRKSAQDLHGLLVFLRYKPLSDDARLWSHLITNHRHLFRGIWGDIALRHTKAQVRDELRLPAQKRVVLTVPFSAVEQQHYGTLFTEMCEAVGVNADGSPKNDDWSPEHPDTVEAMRSWLVRLRQTCLHPQVGGRNRKALGRGVGPLRTIGEVLEVMVEQNETNTRAEERLLLASTLLRAHILGNNGEDAERSMKALEIYTDAMATTVQFVQEARQRLAHANAAAVAREEAHVEEDTDAEGSASESTPELGRLRTNLRTALQLQHACTFFAATAIFQIKTNEILTPLNSDIFKDLDERETALYEGAKQLRKEILKDPTLKAEATMRKIKALEKKGTKMPKIADLELAGIEGRRLVEKSDELFDVIRAQVKHILEMRSKMAEYLVMPLVDEDGEGLETTGEEYETSTKQQDELYVYFDIVKAMQADLNSFITGENAPLADWEMKSLERDVKNFLDPETENRAVPHAPELFLKLLPIRNKFRASKDEVGSVRGLIQEARGLETAMQGQISTRHENESLLIHRNLTALQKVFSDYTKALSSLEKEVDLFRTAQNQRLDFYRQLQELSDAVAPYKEEVDAALDVRELELVMARVEHQSTNLAQLKTKSRFLLNLREDSGGQDSPKICVICQSSFENGVLTVCGHQYCKECIHHWWTAHRTCPVCKRRLHTADFHNITYKPQELKAQEEVHSGSSPPGDLDEPRSSSSTPTQSPSTSIYSDVDTKLMDEIKSIDLPTSYGTKIDTLGRHLHWLREHDPGAKSIVFSQYREFLDVLGAALHEFKLGFSRLGRAGAVEKFRHDPSIDCLLLDAKTDSSGLTLVNATHVFVCEPLIQTAVELQAIARVHRIGQTRQTTVWMYLVGGTVEEAVYEISVARRLALVQSRLGQGNKGKSRSATPAAVGEMAIEAANSEELKAAPMSKLLVGGKSGGEMVGDGDLWQCLFGKAQKVEVKASVEMEVEVGRHLRAEAAVMRRVADMQEEE